MIHSEIQLDVLCSNAMRMRNRLSKTMRTVGRTMLTSYPLLGLCKTPTILWILSMATLCWKLLKPVNQKQNTTIRIYTLRFHSHRKACRNSQCLSHTQTCAHTLLLMISVKSCELMSQPHDCHFTHAALWTTSIGCINTDCCIKENTLQWIQANQII